MGAVIIPTLHHIHQYTADMKAIFCAALAAAGVHAGPVSARPETELNSMQIMEATRNSINDMMRNIFSTFQAQMDKDFATQMASMTEQQKQFENQISERLESAFKGTVYGGLGSGLKPEGLGDDGFPSIFENFGDSLSLGEGDESGPAIGESQMSMQQFSSVNGDEKKVTVQSVTKNGSTATTKTIVENGVTTIEVYDNGKLTSRLVDGVAQPLVDSESAG